MSEKKTKSISIDLNLFNEINDYCKLNNIKVGIAIENMLRKQFLIEKWGEIPQIFVEKQEETPQQEKIEEAIVVKSVKETTNEISDINKEEKIILVKPSKRRLK